MSIWRRLFGKADPRRAHRLDYLNEAMALERQGDLAGAITSYRLGLRDNPNDLTILQNIAIAFSKTGQVEEAIRHYRRALAIDGTLSGAHYGIAFLLIKKGDPIKGAEHLRTFLASPPRGPDAARWVQHAQTTLQDLPLPESGETESAPPA
jgi:tetratricopeptide (TPR) repeat protein